MHPPGKAPPSAAAPEPNLDHPSAPGSAAEGSPPARIGVGEREARDHRLGAARRLLQVVVVVAGLGGLVAGLGSWVQGLAWPNLRPAAVRVVGWPQEQQRGAGCYSRAPLSHPGVAEGFGPGLQHWTQPAWRTLNPPLPPIAPEVRPSP